MASDLCVGNHRTLGGKETLILNFMDIRLLKFQNDVYYFYCLLLLCLFRELLRVPEVYLFLASENLEMYVPMRYIYNFLIQSKCTKQYKIFYCKFEGNLMT